MPYNQFTLKRACEQFDLTVQDADLFPKVPPHPLRDDFIEWFDSTKQIALAVDTEKAKSEWIIAPLLMQAKQIAGNGVQLFSGVELNVDVNRGLNGVCDFVFARGRSQHFLTAPVLTIVEAKNDNLSDGIGQCIAEMVAAQEFNRAEQSLAMLQVVHGLVTIGSAWKFLRLEGSVLQLDLRQYYADDPEQIIGVLLHILRQGAATP